MIAGALTSPHFASNDWPGWLETASDVSWPKAAVLPGAGGRRVRGAWGRTSREGRSEALQMSRRDNAAVFPLHPGKEEHKRERKWGLCAFNEIVFCIQRGFQLLWGRWKALLATLKCLVLPAFGSMRGARTKYTTVQCKLSGKKLIQHRAIRTTGKQGGVDGLPCRSALSFLLEESCSRWRSGTRAAQRKVRGQQVSEGSNNLEKLLFQCGREWTGTAANREPVPSAGLVL